MDLSLGPPRQEKSFRSAKSFNSSKRSVKSKRSKRSVSSKGSKKSKKSTKKEKIAKRNQQKQFLLSHSVREICLNNASYKHSKRPSMSRSKSRKEVKEQAERYNRVSLNRLRSEVKILKKEVNEGIKYR